MKLTRFVLLCGAWAAFSPGPIVHAEDSTDTDQLLALDGSDLTGQLRERQEKIDSLSSAEQESLGNARQKAVDDPAVKAAMEARNQAMRELRRAVVESMIEVDPSLKKVLQKMMAASGSISN